MSVATLVLFVMNEIEMNNAINMLAIGLVCITMNEFLK